MLSSDLEFIAEEWARLAADRAKSSRERDVLLQKARKAEATADAARRLDA